MNIRNRNYNFNGAAREVETIFDDRSSGREVQMDGTLREYLTEATNVQKDLSCIGERKLVQIDEVLGKSGSNPIYPKMANIQTPSPHVGTVVREELKYVIQAFRTAATIVRVGEQSKEISRILN